MTGDAVLPALPGVWSDDLGGFTQRWAPGAFGDLADISHVFVYKVTDEDWDVPTNGAPRRTILAAEIVESHGSAGR